MTKYLNYLDRFDDVVVIDWTDNSWKFNKISNSFPFCDIWIDTKTKELKFNFALAGYDKKNFEVLCDRGCLTIKHPGLKKLPEVDYIHSGIKFSGFERAFSLPDYYKNSIPDVTFENGLLCIVIKIDEESKPKKIEIK
jgi:HSP20 family molecular chaperone IbpA